MQRLATDSLLSLSTFVMLMSGSGLGCAEPRPAARPATEDLPVGAAHAGLGSREGPTGPRTRACTITAGDGTATVQTLREDASGRPTQIEVRSGVHESSVTRTYDAAGRVASEQIRTTHEGEVVVSSGTWERDGRGRMTRATRTIEQSGKHPGPARQIVAELSGHDASGRWTRRETITAEPPMQVTVRTLDELGRVRETRTSAVPKQTLDRVTVQRFTYAGTSPRPSREVDEVSVDGRKPVVEHEAVYDAAGRKTRERLVTFDARDGWYAFTYDASGRLISQAREGEAPATYAYAGDCPSGVEQLLEEMRSDNDDAPR